MSILIKGVHAPVDCQSCPFRSILGCYPEWESIPQGCPIVEVKENDDGKKEANERGACEADKLQDGPA